MWDVFARLRIFVLGLGVLAAGSVVEASVISFKAVKKNDVAIPGGPTNNLAVLANDKIELELFLSNWINDFPVDATPNRVRIFQVTVDRAGYVSNDNGTAKPLGWCGPVDEIPCTQSSTCPAEYPICQPDPLPGCTCAPFDPTLGCFITTTRTDFLLFGVDGILPECTTSEIGVKYFGFADNQNQAITDTGVPRYLGTLIVKVSANACGTFTIGSVQEITSTFITDMAVFKPTSSLPSVQPLVLTVSDCSRQLLSCSPGHCNIDARIAHDRLDEFAGRNPFQTVMTFSKTVVGSCSNAPATPCTLNSQCPGGTCTGRLDLEVTVLPFDPDDTIPAITSITAGADPKIATIGFQPRIQQTRWTCIRDKGSNKRCCMGSLPPDADNNRISQSDDVFELFDNLSGCLNPPTCNAPLLPIEKCDIDRSTRCTGADLVMAVDVLTGADAFATDTPPTPGTSGDQLPALTNQACPDMRLPP